MIKAIMLIKKRPDMTSAEFTDYWLNHHGPIVRRLPGMRRFVQNPVLPELMRTAPMFDGDAESWWDDMGAIRAMLKTDEPAAMIADEAAFIERNSLTPLLVREAEGPL
jgi:uncharacterized protein (TIGR02118 family)